MVSKGSTKNELVYALRLGSSEVGIQFQPWQSHESRLTIGDWRLATVGSKRILNSSCVGSCAVDSELGDSINVNVE